MRYAILALILLLSACDARRAHPVRISQTGDDQLSCEAISKEIQSNRRRGVELGGADTGVEARNVAVGTAAVAVFWPALFALDLSQKEMIEIRALHDRNRHLTYLYEKKSCDESPADDGAAPAPAAAAPAGRQGE